MYLKIAFILSFLLYQNLAYSKVQDKNDFNHEYLSDYFSALVSYDNKQNKEALKFFENSKNLIKYHNNFLFEYVFSLVIDGQVKKSINQIKKPKNKNLSNFFEADLLLVLDSIAKKDFNKANLKLKKLEMYAKNDTYQLIIYQTLKDFNNLFISKQFKKKPNNFGKLDIINYAFQNCYLNSENTGSYFSNLINTPGSDYSRYSFFYISYLIQNEKYNSVYEISKNIDPLRNSLLLIQTKKWIDDKKLNSFENYFSCQNENDLLAEFFFLISNIYSSQDMYNESNFYLNISSFLNPKFYFNLILIADNYYLNSDYDLARDVLKNFNYKDEIYHWYRIKKTSEIIYKESNQDKSLDYLEKKIKDFKNPSLKVLYDIAGIYKKFKNYKKAIDYFSLVLDKVEIDTYTYADVLYRRGGCFERLGKYNDADNDFLRSLKIRPNEPYTLNYLAYSWLERKYKIDEAITMLNNAYAQKENDPYIIDSVGWGYYLIEDYINAEKFLRKAVELLPDDPIASDHYGDALWKLNRKIQARYFWESALNSDETDEEMKKKIQSKLLNGIS